jgi:filamentous hemagglutinin
LNGGRFIFVKSDRAISEFVDGVTVVDRNTGTIFTGTVDLRSTLERIKTGVKSVEGRNDGAVFNNNQLRLPIQPSGYYTEFVHPTPNVTGAGPQRIVTGAGGEVYYTPDHYTTFIRLDK